MRTESVTEQLELSIERVKEYHPGPRLPILEVVAPVDQRTLALGGVIF